MRTRLHFPLLAAAFALPAAAATWTGDTDASWATSGNWTGTAPDNITSQAIVYDSNSDANLTQTLDGSYTVTGITLTSPTGAVVVNNGTGTNLLTIGSDGIDLSSATQNLTLNVTTTVDATQSWNIASGRTLLRSGGTTTFGTGTITTLSGAGIVEIGGTQALTGSGNLVIDGVQFNNNLQGGTQTRTGATTLTSGIIRISTSISLFGAGAINLNGGAIGSFNTTGRVIGNNSVNIGGNIQIGGGSPLSTGFIRFDGATDLGGATRELTAIANGVNSGFGSGAIFTGVISNGGITKAGGGIMTLTNDGNTFTGATTVNAGNLAISNGALANSSSVTLANSGAILSLGINGTTTVKNFSGVSGSQVRTDFTISGTTGNRILAVNQTTDGEFAGSFTQGTSRPISLIKEGAATLTLTGTGTYTGTTTVNAGTLKIAGAGLLGGGTYAGNITNDATLHFDSTANQTLSGIISGTGALLKSNTGTLILTNNSDGNTGSLTISGGTLQVGNNTTAGFIGNGVTITNNSAMVWHRSNETNVGNDISGTGTLTKLGGSILSLNGDSTYTGATTVSEGTLRVNGSLGNTAVSVASGATLSGTGTIGGAVTVSGAIAPGSTGIGTLTVGNDVTWNSGNSWKFDLSDTDTTSDQLAVTGAFTRGSGAAGSFAFDFLGSTPVWNTTYTLATFASTDFSLSDFDLPGSIATLGNGPYSTSSFQLTPTSLTFTAVPEPSTALGGLLLATGLLRRRRRGER